MTASARKSRQQPDPRRQARLAAVQALYQVELGEATPDTVVLEFLQHRLEEDVDGLMLGEVDRTLFGDLVKRVVARREDLGATAAAALSEGWSFQRLETLLRIILLCGTHELIDRPDIPARAVINEYVDLAKAFFSEREPNLVNGVLDRLAHRLRPDEMGEAPAPPAGDPDADATRAAPDSGDA